MIRPLPKVGAATALVAVSPVLAVWGLTSLGVVQSPLLAAGLGAALSLAIYHVAANVWQRRTDAADVLFGDLMLWGWLQRCVQQRRIADTAALLGAGRRTATGDPMQLSPARRVQMLEQLASDLEARDPYTLGHSRRVARYSALIAKRMGVPQTELSRIRTAAAVHDIGKLETPLEVLHKPGALTDAEFAVIKRHPVDGARMVAILEDAAMTEIVLRHHERLDGSGYPGGLRGDEVPLGARVIAVADTFDAITSSRSYRAARPHKQALDILRAEAGSRLDGEAVDAFLSAYLGRRPFGIWIALTNLGERVLAWLAGEALGTGTRLAAIAAGTAAVGSGALALHAPSTLGRSGASAARVVLSRDRVSSSGLAPTRGLPSRTPGTSRPAGSGGAGGRSLRFGTGAGRGASRPGGAIGAPAPGLPVAGSPAPPTSSSAGSVAGSGGATLPGTPGAGGLPSTVSVGAGSPAGPAKVGLGVGTGTRANGPSISLGVGSSQSAGTPNVGVQVTGASGSGSGGAGTISAGASVGPVSAGVTATVGGSAPPKVGISVGGLPPIKIP